jgi:hypothetical protein
MPPRPPPAPATDEARADLEEIFLRFPPDDPFRTSDFARRYREFHRAPPLLGFFEKHDTVRLWLKHSPPTPPFLPLHPDHNEISVPGRRHGIVLLRTPVSNNKSNNAVVPWVTDGPQASVSSPLPEPRVEIAYFQSKFPVAFDFNRCIMGFTILPFGFITHDKSMIHGPGNIMREPPAHVDGQNRQDVLGCDESGLSVYAVPYGSVEMLPIFCNTSIVISSDDGIGDLYLRTTGVIFTVDLKSGKLINIGTVRNFSAIPYMSFYTPGDSVVTIFKTVRNFESFSKAVKLEFVIPHIFFFLSGQAMTISGHVGNEDGGGWEEVGNRENEEEAAQELFSNWSKAFEDGDFVSAVDCLRRSLEIRLGFFLSISLSIAVPSFQYGLLDTKPISSFCL